MKKYNLKRLIKKYNKILSERYGVKHDLLEDYSLDSLETIQAECWTDSCQTWQEAEYLKRYLYYRTIKNDIKNFIEFEKEEKRKNGKN